MEERACVPFPAKRERKARANQFEIAVLRAHVATLKAKNERVWRRLPTTTWTGLPIDSPHWKHQRTGRFGDERSAMPAIRRNWPRAPVAN
jgi:hypothetical protein